MGWFCLVGEGKDLQSTWLPRLVYEYKYHRIIRSSSQKENSRFEGKQCNYFWPEKFWNSDLNKFGFLRIDQTKIRIYLDAQEIKNKNPNLVGCQMIDQMNIWKWFFCPIIDTIKIWMYLDAYSQMFILQ